MKTQLLAFLLLLICFTSTAQNKETDELRAFLKNNNIELGNPTPLSGYKVFRDCNNGAVYKRVNGDTIIMYNSASSIAENIDRFKITAKSKDFNTLVYPIYFQDNATVVVQHMKKQVFLFRNDTLYLFDSYNEKKSQDQMKLIFAVSSKKITESEFDSKMKALEMQIYDTAPAFKMIYFKGIFKNGDTYRFSKKQNYLEESVHLDDKWMQNNKECFKINLKTHTNGRYMFSEDMVFLSYENCQIDTRLRLNN